MTRMYILAVFAGVLYYVVSRLFWAIYVSNSGLNAWLVLNVLPHGERLYYAIVFLHDFIVHVAVAYPFALAFLRLPLRQRSICLALVVLPAFVFEYRLVLADLSLLRFFLTNAATWFGIIVTLGMLPFTTWLASTQRSLPVAHNNTLERTDER